MSEYRFPPLPERLLLGPGPSNVSPQVLEALSRPLLGHLDPDFLNLMSEIQDLLRQVFQTANRLTIPISGTGSAGMEAAVVNFVNPGDSVLVGIHGVFGGRIADCVGRCGGQAHTVTAPWGEPLDEKELTKAAEACRPKMIAVVHAETSTGVLQPLEPVRRLAERFDALLLVDAVTSLAGHPVGVDDQGIDICYSGSQKCLSCPPGLAPLTVSQRARERFVDRCPSWYLDLRMVGSYWGKDRSYHHTAPISMNYAIHQALGLVVEEGLEQRWERHKRHQAALIVALSEMNLEPLVAPGYRLWPLTTVRVPEGIDEAQVRSQLLDEFNLEIGGGLGALQGKVWRVGLMGENSRPEPLLRFLDALEACLKSQGHRTKPGAGVSSAVEFLSDAKSV